ncbi:hypothetical protein F5I97DRAFT_1799000 [Phlebopus sp. FC_14]|nr:hypothetical protein F5I97DRAFT_1799000 [Phlebopus sp. FC_14]
MDVDWCLSCECRIVSVSTSGPYCSPECLSYAQPSSSTRINPPPPRPVSPAYRIRQWAQAIPPHVPAGAPDRPFADHRPSLHFRPPSPRARQPPTPKLIERAAVSTPLPTLCVSSPAHVRPLPPANPSPRIYSSNTPATMSEASTSLTSLLTEPMVATPDEDCCFGSGIGALVRSLVPRDRDNARTTKVESVVEKVSDYFPPPAQVNKASPAPPSSTKAKKTKPPSPTSSRQKLPAKKTVKSYDRDSLTPTHHTPVVFPSCRAADLDWDDGEDDEEVVVALQPRYHLVCQQKDEPQRQHAHGSARRTRAPSPAASVSSTGSSVLLMAPKRRDGIKGRKGAAC